MISMAALGLPAAAAAWSHNEEERRKALFSYLGAGLPFLIWDNIARGSTVSCTSIERSLTTEFYTDRVLGEFEDRDGADLHRPGVHRQQHRAQGRSRVAIADRTARHRPPDPENRKFKHADIIAWTDANRGHILQAAYTILLGNPRRGEGEHAEAPTRFKVWWDVVGSAVEYAAKLVADENKALVADPDRECPAEDIAFKDLFLDSEADEEETSSLAQVLETIRREWPSGARLATSSNTSEEVTIFKTMGRRCPGPLLALLSS